MIQKAVGGAVEQFALETKNQAAERLDFETKLRKQMQELVVPMVELGGKHKEQFVHNIHAINDHEQRLAFLEYAIFKSDHADDRFEDVFRKMAEMEKERVCDAEASKTQLREHQ
jgi:hypothetical protein